MDRAAVEQLLDELLSSIEALETRGAAILQFLKDEGYATEDQLAPYMEQAGNASSVRWRAARLRMMSLLNSAMKGEASRVTAESSAKDEETAEKDTPASATSKREVEGKSAQGAQAKSSARRDRTAAGASGQFPQTSATGERNKGPAEEEGSAARQPQETIQSNDNTRATTTGSTADPNRAQSQEGSEVEQRPAKTENQPQTTKPNTGKEDAA
jgi:hypothetical protein